jgi:translocation and assembly module TamB
MGRRRAVVLLSSLAMLLLGGGIVGGLIAATQSDGGRDWLRRQLARQLASGMKGTLHLGKLSGSFLTDLTIDSLMIRDRDDSVFASSGPIRLTYDPRDILDGRIIVRSIELQHPFVVMRREYDDRWNFRKVFPTGDDDAVGQPIARRGFGALVVLHNVRVRGGHFQLTLPWDPDDSLKGARRDSAVAVNLALADHEIRRVPTKGKTYYQRSWHWQSVNATFNRVRLRQPDSTGRQFDIARLDVSEPLPPFAWRNVRGGAVWRGDSIWIDFTHLELPGSVARAKGKMHWGNDLPIRYDIRVHSDSVAMNDIAWIFQTLPRTGGGAMDLHIKNERDLRILDYAITNIDAHSNGSHIRGAMTYGVGGPVLIVKDVNLQLLPVDFALLETLNGKKYPYPWHGQITGTLRAPGGPVNHFKVDEAKFSFADANVPGAITRGTAQGEIDILDPGRTKFHGLQLDIAQLDLRTPQFLNPNFPRLNGTIAGTGIVDSVWTDVRFHDVDITHRDGDIAPPSRFKGSGRMTVGEGNIAFDLTAAALPLSATAVAQSYPGLPLRGEYSGPLHLKGTVADLTIQTDLVGTPGRVQLDGQFDAEGPRYRAVARGAVSGLNFRRAFERAGLPHSDFSGRFSMDLEGDSLANAIGGVELFADRSTVDSIRIFSGRAGLRLASGTLGIDSMRVESSAGLLTANGGLGLVDTHVDTVRFRTIVDSLGGLRRYLSRVRADTGLFAIADSLGGTITATGTVVGWTHKFALQGAFNGTDLRFEGTTARQLSGSVRLGALPDSATGTVAVRFDTVRTVGISLARVEAAAELRGGSQATVTAAAEMPRGTRLRARAEVVRHGVTTDVRLDSLALNTAANAWSLQRTGIIALTPGGVRLDTLSLVGAGGGRITVGGQSSADSVLALLVQADRVPLADVGEVMQTESSFAGTVSVRADVRGTHTRPDLFFSGLISDALIGGVRIESLQADGRYAERQLTTTMEYSRLGIPAFHAEAMLPIDLALNPTGPRLLEEPLTGRIRTDSIGLVLFESFSKAVSGASGALDVNVDLGGTWKHPRMTGALRVLDGAFMIAPIGDVKLSGLDADIRFLGDSIDVQRLTVHSGLSRTATATLRGYIGIRDIENPTFGLSLETRGFNVIKRPLFADLDLTGELTLTGAWRSATLAGNLEVNRGVIYVPELYQKRVISLDDPELYRVVDTTALLDRRVLPQPTGEFMDNLRVLSVPVRMGRDVWLRSEEANINLGGLVNITRGRVQRGPNAGTLQLALDGPLQTVRGTYRLNLGPVQRPFDVETGEIRFYGDPDLNATLNINALHTVRQYSQSGSRPDVRVRVHIGGTLLSPTAELSSPDSIRVTNADLISYLVTGAPSYEITARSADYTSTAARLLLSSSFSVLGSKVAGTICDDAQISAAGLDAYQGRLRDVSSNILSGTRFNCAKQLSEKTFVRVDYGLCQVGQLLGGGTNADPLSLTDALGIKLDYRLSPGWTASLGMDPATSAVLCARDAIARGFAPTPRQFGFDLFRIWRF